ncbi:SGNH/GDSL hydrolase family protein [Leptospira ilyithenensis]|uniref:SGNH/GDSL hydrolase family protein n=2 Tax=Leptospira ilyithenensis TaxID=2484901 RepID=A0A4R9LQ51_9LEPT|nr:SGNH/GDSL hydrolase family protein [Leptospira ilyithenensis]
MRVHDFFLRQIPISFVLLFIGCYSSKKDTPIILALLNQPTSSYHITIVGDSLSQLSDGFGLKYKLPTSYSIRDMSVAGYGTEDWLVQSPELEALSTDIWLIELGVNDANLYGTTNFLTRYKELLSRLEKNSISLFILTAVPLTDYVDLRPSIKTNNQSIRDLVQTKPNYKLADIEKVFSTYSGLPPLYSLNDPVHPNQLGLEIMGNEYQRILLGF